MPTAKKNKNGVWTLVCYNKNLRRKLTLGMIESADAKAFAANVDLLKDCKKHNRRIPINVKSWIKAIDQSHRLQLAEIGLLEVQKDPLTVDDLIQVFLDDYKDRTLLGEVKPTTLTRMRGALARFPSKLTSKLIEEIEPKQREDRPNSEPVFSTSTKRLMKSVESYMREHFAKATWSRTHGNLREVGFWAVKRGYCDHNPFVLLPSPGETNAEKNFHVPAEWICKIIDLCPDPDVKIMFALGRFAGLRIPSEARTMEWSWVDFKNKSIKVADSKRKGVMREMPIFPDLMDYLTQHWAETCEQRYLLSPRMLRASDSLSYSDMRDAVLRSEFEPWKRLRQNLRTSCENDLLAAGFQERLVIRWIGHTKKISRDHYQNQTQADIDAAIEKMRGKFR